MILSNKLSKWVVQSLRWVVVNPPQHPIGTCMGQTLNQKIIQSKSPLYETLRHDYFKMDCGIM